MLRITRCLRRAGELSFAVWGEAAAVRGIYALSVNRPMPTALGWRLPTWLLDFGPVVLVLVVGTAAIRLRPQAGGFPAAVLWLVLFAEAGALLLRHRAPLTVLGLTLALALAVDYLPIVTLPALFAIFTIAEYRDRRTVLVAAAVTAVALAAAEPIHGHPQGLAQTLSHVVVVGLATALGLYLRARADYVAGLRERADQADRERELLAVKAVADERVRIARELHDVVAHNVSLMVVQAQALEATRTHGAEEQASLRRLAGLGREALSEMHRMLGLLRLEEGGGADRQPQPGVAELETLVGRTGQAGIDARLTIEGQTRSLPPAVDLSAYRIVQEALTNVIRHAHAEHVTVRLRYFDQELRVTVVDDGMGPPEGLNGAAGGHGLIGMRERVALFGGKLEAGPGPAGRGYRVEASLPTG